LAGPYIVQNGITSICLRRSPLAGSHRRRTGPINRARSSYLSPDGKSLLLALDGNMVQVFDVSGGEQIGKSISGRPVPFLLSPDRGHILLKHADGVGRIWNLSKGTEVSRIAFHFEDNSEFTLDSSRLVHFGSDGNLTYWKVATGQPDGEPVHMGLPERDVSLIIPTTLGVNVPVQLRKPAPIRVAFAVDRAAAAVLCGESSDGQRTVQLWDLKARTLIAERTVVAKKGSETFDFSFTPDGQSIFLLTGENNPKAELKSELHIWRCDGMHPVESPGLEMDNISSLEFSPDGKTAIAVPNASISYKSVFEKNSFHLAFLDTASWKSLGKSAPIQGYLQVGLKSDIRFLPDGKTFVLQKYDLQGGKSMIFRQLWDLAQRKPITRPADANVMAGTVAYSADGRFLWSDEVKQFQPFGLGWREVATDKQIGPVYPLGAPVQSAFNAGSRYSVPPKQAFGLDNAGYLWQFAPPSAIHGNPERIRLWVEVITGLELDDAGEVQQLSAATWQQRKQRLEELGGPPAP